MKFLYQFNLLIMVFISLFFLSGCQLLFNAIPHASPLISFDEKISVNLFVNSKKELTYQINFQNETVVLPSKLGISVNGVDLGVGVKLGKTNHTTVDFTYHNTGSNTDIRNNYKQYEYPITHEKTGIEYYLQLRIYDNGVGYRYIVPGKGKQHVNSESSSWVLPENFKTWIFERPNNWKLKSYAGYWISTGVDKLPEISKAGPIHGTPIVFELDNKKGYMAITRAALYNYSGMRIKSIGNNTLVANFTEGKKGFYVDGDITTPWRVTMLASNLHDLSTSHLIANFNPAPDPKLFADQRYIQPGKSVWRWPTSFTGTPTEEKEFVDYASKLGFKYSLVDGKWENWPTQWQSITELVSYAKNKNVNIWTWVHSKDLLNPLNNYQQMHDYFSKVKQAGIVGLKIDFMDSESKVLIDFEIAVLRIAAEYQLMINFHGCHASTGEARTYPNEMTREGVRGIEVNNMKIGPLSASHNAALPFTRLLMGHADYTPVYYNNPGPTSWAHQLATAIIFDSPLQVISEHPDILFNQAKLGLSVLKEVPTVWDETLVLPESKIGELASFARRSGDVWFLAVLNGGPIKNYKLDLSFLGDGSYKVDWVEDDLNIEKTPLTGLTKRSNLKEFTHAIPFKVTSKDLNKFNSPIIELAEGGGFVAVFKLKKQL